MDQTQIQVRMQKVIDDVKLDIGGIRTGRATPALVQDIVVSVYGGMQKLRVIELATITVSDIHTLLISPWDKSIIGDIKKGIEAANVGLTPIVSGEEIRINLPPMTLEDRENYIKLLHQKLENGKVSVRQVRQDAMKNVEQEFGAKEISEDQKNLFEKKIQEMTDKSIQGIDKVGIAKESELRSL